MEVHVLRDVWTVLSPPSATTVTPPALAPALAAYAPPTALDGYLTPAFAAAADMSTFASYDTARAAATLFTVSRSLQFDSGGSPVSQPLPVDGRMKLTAYGPNDNNRGD